jgi:hypothetical protein
VSEELYERLQKATGEAREVIAELHGILKDIKEVKREAQKVVDEIMPKIMGHLDKSTEAGLSGYSKSILEAIDNATAAVYKRFDTLADTLLGEDKAAKRKGKPSLQEVTEARNIIDRFLGEPEGS